MRNTFLFVAMGVFAISMFGCANNVSNIKSSSIGDVPKSKIYSSNFDKVWSVTISKLSQDETIKVSDKSSGIIVTEYRTVDGEELSLVDTYFMGSTYKYSYSINLLKETSGGTEVIVNVKLMTSQFALLNKETKDAVVENYLRKKLFESLSSSLKGKG